MSTPEGMAIGREAEDKRGRRQTARRSRADHSRRGLKPLAGAGNFTPRPCLGPRASAQRPSIPLVMGQACKFLPLGDLRGWRSVHIARGKRCFSSTEGRNAW
jgi:hypothetical protein